ncbi:MAG: hypothetical protein HYW25_04305 [Candidatus Aenigmarchaeota archaeon]|nr:hypothetical protein [Candidatus Aenigmarchaeota archaeon]
MEIKVLEKSENKVRLEIDDRTFVNMLNDKMWELGKSEYSARKQEHPYTTKPEFIIKAKDPKAAMIDATEEIIKDFFFWMW